MARYVWENIEEMFAALHNAKCKYVILRNYEEIDAGNFYTSGHADIDFLTANSKYFIKITHAFPRFVSDDGIHYLVNIGGTEVVLDIRSVGDGYYDRKWEDAILSERICFDKRFYIPDEKNYYYSLVYHAILQKQKLSEEYLGRLNLMAPQCGVVAATKEEHLAALESYMHEKGYRYTVPYDVWVPLKTEYIDPTKVKKVFRIYVRDMKTAAWQFGSKVKHKLLGR